MQTCINSRSSIFVFAFTVKSCIHFPSSLIFVFPTIYYRWHLQLCFSRGSLTQGSVFVFFIGGIIGWDSPSCLFYYEINPETMGILLWLLIIQPTTATALSACPDISELWIMQNSWKILSTSTNNHAMVNSWLQSFILFNKYYTNSTAVVSYFGYVRFELGEESSL